MIPDRIQILSYDEEQRIRGALAAAAEADGLQAPEHVERALLAELRRRNRRMAAGQIAVVAGLAAALLVGLFFARPTAPLAPVAREVVTAAAAPSDPPKPVIAKAIVKRPVRRASPKRAKMQMAAVEPSDFIPMGPWQAMEPMERGSIIRVRLSKSALPGFGIPVSADRWNESIPADVVLGEDGTMRAVRFVNTRR
ncbi:MAG: hypothetical protein ACKV2U_23870 [Bryobacteraceae bacterium]